MKALTDKTLVPVGLAVIVIGTASFAFAGILNKQSYNSEKIAELTNSVREHERVFNQILIEMAEMKGILKRMERSK